MLVQRPKPRASGPQRYGVEQLGPAGAVLPRDPQLLQRLSEDLAEELPEELRMVES